MPWFKPPPPVELPRRAALPTLPGAYDSIPVKTEAELLSALGLIAQRFRTLGALPTTFGGEIVIVRPFKATKTPYALSEKHTGVVIRALGGASIVPSSSDQGVLWDIRGPLITIRDTTALYQNTSSGTPTAWFNTFVEVNDAAAGFDCSHTRIINNTLFVDRIWVDATSANAEGSFIVDNVIVAAPNGTHAASILFNSEGCVIRGNVLDDGGGNSIQSGAAGESCIITGNDFAGGDYDGSAGVGSNTISANVRVGAAVLGAGDDDTGGNT